jgi:hypothetical protein
MSRHPPPRAALYRAEGQLTILRHVIFAFWRGRRANSLDISGSRAKRRRALGSNFHSVESERRFKHSWPVSWF